MTFKIPAEVHQLRIFAVSFQHGFKATVGIDRYLARDSSVRSKPVLTSWGDVLRCAQQRAGRVLFLYNHARPHQNLGGATPAKVLAGVDPHTTRFKQEYWFEAWDGLLQGYYFLR